MMRILVSLTIVALCVVPLPLRAQNAGGQRIAACSLLPKAEVKKHVPWNDIVDSMPPEEEPVGANGAACQYASVRIQVFPAQRLVRGQPTTEPGWQQVAGVGEEAWYRPNRTRYAELYVKTSTHTLMIQASANGNPEAVKPGTVSLAKALLAKLPAK
jgi:hypothetical protein